MIRSFPIIVIALVAAAICGAQTPGSPTHSDSGAPAAPATQQPAPQPAAPQQTPAPPASAAPQQTPPKAEAAPPAVDPATTVPATVSVITVEGLCTPAAGRAGTAGSVKRASTGKTSAGAPCKTVVTKAQFDKILDSVNPGNQAIAPSMRRNFAQTYVDLLTFSQAAQKAGIDKDPNFIEFMRLIRMKTLQDFYRRNLEKADRALPDSEIQAYYNQNIQKYEQIKMSRIFIPAKNPSAAVKDEWEKKASQEANDIHDRAVKGEDFEKLQKEAYTTLGLTIAPPSTNTGTRRRPMAASGEEKDLFDLKSGEVSKVQQEPAGYIIYKVESKETLPESQVKDEISRELFRQKLEGQLKSVSSTVHANFNDEYFGPANQAPTVLRPGTRAGGALITPGERPEPNTPAPKQPGPAPAPNAPSTTNPASPGQAPPK